MAAYPLDSWKTIFPHLDAWLALTPAQRRVAATMESRYEPANAEFAAMDPSLKKRLLETDSMGLMRPTPGLKRLQSFIARLGAWCGPEQLDIGRFVDLYTTYAQRYALTGARGLSQGAVTAAYDKSL